MTTQTKHTPTHIRKDNFGHGVEWVAYLGEESDPRAVWVGTYSTKREAKTALRKAREEA